MPFYDVLMYVTGQVTKEIEASSPEEAESAARNSINSGDFIEIEVSAVSIDGVEVVAE